MAHRYLVDVVPGVGGAVRLEGDEARHAGSVARLRVGEATTVGDGRGRVATAAAEAVARDAVALRVTAVREEPEPRPRVLLVQALAKGGRDELAIQAATELGVAEVAPWAAERSVTRWTGAKAQHGHERWASIVREAGKQALRAWIPTARPLLTGAAAAALPAERTVLVLDPDADARLVDALPPDFRDDLAIVVGPEGGIAPGELAALAAAGARPVRLGRDVLRTSTAAPAALAALAVHLDLWP